MAEAPAISVILPTRNRAGLLPRAIGSVLAQRFRDLELIVVDDASSDDTPALLAQLDDPRLRVLRRERNSGAAAARNAGLALARGRYVAFQDDDDFWLLGKLQAQWDCLQARAARWCLAPYLRLEDDGRASYIGGAWYASQLDYRRGVGEEGPNWSLIATPGWLVERTLIQSLGGFDERIRSWDDWELGLRLWRQTRPEVLDEPLWVQDWLRGSGLTRAERVRANDLQLIVEKHADLWADCPAVQAQHAYVIGRILSLYDPAPAGRRELWQSLRARPTRALGWLALAMSYLGPARAQRLTAGLRRFKKWWRT